MMDDDDDKAFRAGLVSLIGPLRGYARALVGQASAADDLVQEAMLRALHAQRQFMPGSELRAWLFTILRHTWLESQRRLGREQRATAAMEPATPTEASQGGGMALDRLAAALQALPALQREALLLVGAKGMSGAEAARICGVAEGTLRARVARARQALRRAFS